MQTMATAYNYCALVLSLMKVAKLLIFSSIFTLVIYGINSSNASYLEGLKLVGKPSMEWYNTEDFSARSDNRDLVQVENGDLYFANEQLLRFDGDNWEIIEISEIYKIMSLAQRNNTIFIGGVDEFGYMKLGKARNEYISLSEKIKDEVGSFGELWSIFTSKDKVFFAARKRVFVWDGFELKHHFFETERRVLASQAEDRIFVYQRGHGFYEYREGGFENLLGEENISSGIISVLNWEEDSLLLVTISDGIFIYKQGELQSINNRLSELSKELTVVHTERLSSELFVFSTLKGGLLLFDKNLGLVQKLDRSVGLNSDYYYRTKLDRDGHLWLLSSEGIGMIRLKNSVQLFDEDMGLQGRPVFGFQAYGESNYLTTLNGVFSMDRKQKTIRTISKEFGFFNMSAWEGQLFLPSLNGLFQLDDDNLLQLKGNFRNLFTVFPSKKDSRIAYLGKFQGLESVLRSEGRIEPLSRLEGMDGQIQFLHQLRDGSLLLGTVVQGLYHVSFLSGEYGNLAKAKLTELGADYGLPDSVKWTIPFNVENRVYILCEKGIYHLDEDTLQMKQNILLGDDLGLDPYSTNFSNELSDGSRWISYRNQSEKRTIPFLIGLLSHDNEQLTFDPLKIPGLENVNEIHCLHYEEGSDILSVGTAEGLLEIDLNNLHELAVMPPLIHKSLLGQNGSPIKDLDDSQPGVQIREGVTQLYFEYASPMYGYRNIQYQTKLEGLDQDWRSWSRKTSVDYSNLIYGDYTFKVRAKTPYGDVSEARTFSFTVLKPWFLRWWAFLTYIIVLGLIVFLGGREYGRYRNRNLQKRTEELEKLVNERTTALEEKNLELVVANNSKSQFVANMSHEIRNPMNGIVNMLRLVIKEPMSSKQLNYMEHIISCADFLKNLLNNVLDYSMAEKNLLKIQNSPVELPKIVHFCMDICRMQAKGKQLDLRVEVEDGFPFMIYGDIHRWQQVLVNLIGNAIKFTEQGYVCVRLGGEVLGGDVNILLEVQDTGCGIAQDDQDKVFEKFTQLNRKQDAVHKGTGLGLSISKEIIEEMGGTLSLESEVGKGSTFSINIRQMILLEDFGDEMEVLLQKWQPLYEIDVLVVEDQEYNRIVAKEMLEPFGCRVHLASNGEEAIQRLKEKHYNLVFQDIDLPDMNGKEVAKYYFQNLRMENSETVFIAMTAYSTESEKKEIFDAGIEDFIGKPFDENQLFEILQTFIGEPIRLVEKENTSIFSGAPSTSETPTIKEIEESFMLRSVGDSGAMEKLKEEYLLTLKRLIQDIDKNLNSENLKQVRYFAHQGISLLNHIQYRPLVQEFRFLTDAAKCNNFNQSKLYWDKIKVELEELIVSLTRIPKS